MFKFENIKTYFKEHIQLSYVKTTLANSTLYVYSKYKQYYPICSSKLNVLFMIVLRKFIAYVYEDDYTKNKYVKYLYERFNNDSQYIEEIHYEPSLVMNTTIIRKSDTRNGFRKEIPRKNNNPHQYFDGGEFLSSNVSSLIVFNKVIRGITYHRVFTSDEFQKWKTDHNLSFDDIKTDIYDKFQTIPYPFVFLEIVYKDPTTNEWTNILPHEQIKSICVKGNKLNMETFQFICMKYFNININTLKFKINVLFSKSDTIEEYDRTKLVHEPIVM